MQREDPFQALGPLPERVNIARVLVEAAAELPDQLAITCQPPRGRGPWTGVTYAELASLASRVARGLERRGVRPGDRVCLFVKPGIELIALTYGLFALGAVPVLADPGMGRERLLAVVRRMRPRVFVGIPLAQAARLAFRSAFASVELIVTVGHRYAWGGTTYRQLLAEEDAPLEPRDVHRDETAAILFTSGSTGPPKGVVYTHGMFHAQTLALQALYAFRPGEVDLACFPLFALFDVAFRMTSAIPSLDASRPARCDPALVVRALKESRATSTFGSPAIWQRVVPWCRARGERLDLERVLIAGAPVPPALVAGFRELLPEQGDVHTPYGATESLPVASISGREILALRDEIESGRGTCVGRVAPGIDLRLIEVDDEAVPRWEAAREVTTPRRPGEVCVRGPVVTRVYAEDPAATALAKIEPAEGEPGLWHRMGDLGFLDEEGRLWFGGRKSHRLRTARGMVMPVPLENVFHPHPRVRRAALVGVGPAGGERPVVVVEPEPGEFPHSEASLDRFLAELRALATRHFVTRELDTFLFHPGFPVDPRHNAKIHREELREWAAAELAARGEVPA